MKDRFMHILSLKAADWLAGVIRLEITGFCGERLLTKCAAEGVEFWDIKRTSPERLVVSIYSFRLSTVYAVYNANNGFSPHLEINEIQNIGRYSAKFGESVLVSNSFGASQNIGPSSVPDFSVPQKSSVL